MHINHKMRPSGYEPKNGEIPESRSDRAEHYF